MNNQRILVTGGTGYIGSHTVVELQQSGFEVSIIDNLSNSSYKVVEQIEKITGTKPNFEKIDLLDKERLTSYFEKNKPFHGVIHFAAYKAVGESVKLPLLYYENNLLGLINLLDCMNNYNSNNLVFSSSCTVYGQPKELPVTEKTSLQPATSPYGNTKKIAEDMIRDTTFVNENLKAIVLRYFNPVGAHESALIGELPNGVPNNLMPFITQTAIGKRDVLQVFGNDYNTPDGTAIRDYIHVVDLANAHIAALTRLTKKDSKDNVEFFNIGAGRGYSVLEVINAFENYTHVKLKWKFSARRNGDIEKIWADSAFSNKTLQWKANLGIEEMVTSAWKWEKMIPDL